RLSSRKQRSHDLAPLRAENSNQPSHLQAHVVFHGTRVRKAEFMVGAGGESVGDQGGLGRPPTVDSCFAHVGVGGDCLNAQLWESVLLQQFQGAVQNRLARLLAAWPSGRALLASFIVSSRSVTSVTSVSSRAASLVILTHG